MAEAPFLHDKTFVTNNCVSGRDDVNCCNKTNNPHIMDDILNNTCCQELHSNSNLELNHTSVESVQFKPFYLNICSWNVEGLAKYHDDAEFHSYVSTFDIIGLCETWTVRDDAFNIHGYTPFCYSRPKKKSANRGSGGVSVYVKDFLIKDNLVKRIFDNFTECVVLLFNCSLFQHVNDVVFIFSYVSPENSPIYDENDNNGIDILNININNIIAEYPNTDLFLSGDLNSRIKDFKDFIPDDDISFMLITHLIILRFQEILKMKNIIVLVYRLLSYVVRTMFIL